METTVIDATTNAIDNSAYYNRGIETLMVDDPLERDVVDVYNVYADVDVDGVVDGGDDDVADDATLPDCCCRC